MFVCDGSNKKMGLLFLLAKPILKRFTLCFSSKRLAFVMQGTVVLSLMIGVWVNANAQNQQAEIKFELKSFDWEGAIPSRKRVHLFNPYGSISARNQSASTVNVHATIQNLHGSTLEATFKSFEKNGELFIEVNYDQAIVDEKGNRLHRVDIAILFPPNVIFSAQTDFGTIKLDKMMSSVAAFSTSGDMKISTTGLVHAESHQGDIKLILRGQELAGPSKVVSVSGLIDVEVNRDMSVMIDATAGTPIYFNGESTNKTHYQLSQFERLSTMSLISEKGSIRLNVVEPPALIPSVKPTSKNVDLRLLPPVKPWRPGDEIIERNDRIDHRKNASDLGETY